MSCLVNLGKVGRERKVLIGFRYERFGFEKCADYSEEEGDWCCMRKDLTK